MCSLGVAYNLFDGEELLERSITCVRAHVDFVCVVYQRTSNFGNAAAPHLLDFLEHLVGTGMVDELIEYHPHHITLEEKIVWTSPNAELDCDVGAVQDVFFHEVKKRDIGVGACHARGCTHVMVMDVDEFYIGEELENMKKVAEVSQCDGLAVRMRNYFKRPIYEMTPTDELSWVVMMYKIEGEFSEGTRRHLRLAAPYDFMVDPTRRMDGVEQILPINRSACEMHHMSFVRRNMRSKVENVSNRGNYTDVETFLHEFERWTPRDGILHPHPYLSTLFKGITERENIFGIDFGSMCHLCCISEKTQRCSACKSTRYCGRACQKEDYSRHKAECRRTRAEMANLTCKKEPVAND